MSTNIRTRWQPGYGRTPKQLLRDPRISSHAVRIYSIMDDSNGYDTLSIKTIAEWLGVSYSTAQRAIYELRDTGWVEVIEQEDNLKSRVPNEYIVNEVPFSQSQIREDPPWSPVTRGPGHRLPTSKELTQELTQEPSSSSTASNSMKVTREADDLPAVAVSRWWPHPEAMGVAKEIGTDLELPALAVEYRMWCKKKKHPPTSTQWLEWVTRKQQEAVERIKVAAQPPPLRPRMDWDLDWPN